MDPRKAEAQTYRQEKAATFGDCLQQTQDFMVDTAEYVNEKRQAASAWVSKHYDMLSMGGHFILDGLGMIPGFGIVADGLNTVWYLAEGNYTEAAMSALAMVPAMGQAATAAKLAKKAGTVGDVVRVIDKVDDAAGALNTGMMAPEAARGAGKAAGPLQAATAATLKMGDAVNKFVPKPVQNLLLKRQDELQAGMQFTSETVQDLQTAMAASEER